MTGQIKKMKVNYIMKPTSLKFLLVFLVAGSYSSQLMSMENQPQLLLSMLMGLQKAKKESNIVVAHLNEIVALNDSLLSESDISPKRKETTESIQKNIKEIIEKIQQDQTNLIIYSGGLRPAVRGITFFIADLEQNSQQEPIIKNHLENYYNMLGKLTITDNRVKMMSKGMPKLH